MLKHLGKKEHYFQGNNNKEQTNLQRRRVQVSLQQKQWKAKEKRITSLKWWKKTNVNVTSILEKCSSIDSGFAVLHLEQPHKTKEHDTDCNKQTQNDKPPHL
jgi:hypothetical protein